MSELTALAGNLTHALTLAVSVETPGASAGRRKANFDANCWNFVDLAAVPLTDTAAFVPTLVTAAAVLILLLF